MNTSSSDEELDVLVFPEEGTLLEEGTRRTSYGTIKGEYEGEMGIDEEEGEVGEPGISLERDGDHRPENFVMISGCTFYFRFDNPTPLDLYYYIPVGSVYKKVIAKAKSHDNIYPMPFGLLDYKKSEAIALITLRPEEPTQKDAHSILLLVVIPRQAGEYEDGSIGLTTAEAKVNNREILSLKTPVRSLLTFGSEDERDVVSDRYTRSAEYYFEDDEFRVLA